MVGGPQSMIQFIQVIPIEVTNENYEQDLRKWISEGSQFGLHPNQSETRHENKTIERLFPWSEFEFTKQVTIDNEYYVVKCMGPKEYITSGSLNSFIQKIYIQKL
jgi:hypothetical protein